MHALVIVHLSSLDAFAAECGKPEARALADAIVYAAKDALRAGRRVYVIDQFWSGPIRDPAAAVLRQIGAAFLRFDEQQASWGWFLPRLRGRLRRDGVTRVTIGGLWFDPNLKTGCATEVYRYLREQMPTTVDEDIVGCGCFEDEDEDEDAGLGSHLNATSEEGDLLVYAGAAHRHLFVGALRDALAGQGLRAHEISALLDRWRRQRTGYWRVPAAYAAAVAVADARVRGIMVKRLPVGAVLDDAAPERRE